MNQNDVDKIKDFVAECGGIEKIMIIKNDMLDVPNNLKHKFLKEIADDQDLSILLMTYAVLGICFIEYLMGNDWKIKK